MVVLVDFVKTSDRCNDVSISLTLDRDIVQGEVWFFRVKCQVTRICTDSQHRDGHWQLVPPILGLHIFYILIV